MPTPWLSGDRQPIVGYLGNVASSKGAHVVVDVAERLADRPNVRFVIVGDVWFPHADRGYGSRLRARMRDSPAGDRVAWLETRSPREAMSAIDVLLHPSVEPEPFGRVLVEAMIARRPIVAVGHGGPAEILDGSTAKLTPPGDLDALAAAIRCVVDDRSASSAMADRARVLADEFEPMRIAKAMDAAYASMRR